MDEPFHSPTANEILVRLYTDEGIDGFGLATSYTPIDFVVKAWESGLADQILGEDPLAPERLYQKLFPLTTSKEANERGWSREPGRQIAEFLGDVVVAASAPNGLDSEGLGECRCNKCKGTVITEIAPDDTIEWSCAHCAQQGRISNWRGSFWDLSDHPAER